MNAGTNCAQNGGSQTACPAPFGLAPHQGPVIDAQRIAADTPLTFSRRFSCLGFCLGTRLVSTFARASGLTAADLSNAVSIFIQAKNRSAYD